MDGLPERWTDCQREIVTLEAARDKVQSPSWQRMLNVSDCTATTFKFQTYIILRLKFRLLTCAVA